jgi:NADH:ubiquinone oxidoreductase subunit F (NADH-binding)
MAPPLTLQQHLKLHGELPTGSGNLPAAVTAAGLRGRGGAGFPTGRKMAAVAAARSVRGRILVANGAEGEPASRKDTFLLSHAPHLVLDGMALAATAIGARRAVLCLHEGSPSLGWVSEAVAERRLVGMDRVPLEIAVVPARYVASEESALVNWLTRGKALPTTKPPRPDQRGVAGLPTLVNNVETYAHVALIGRHGERWFRTVGTPAEPGTMLLTVTGAVADPGVVEVEMGVPLSAVLELLGGVTAPISGYLIGGYFGRWLSPAQASGLRLSADGLQDVGGMLGAGVVLALPASVCPLSEAGRVLRWLADQSAGQCGPCRFGLPAISMTFDALCRGQLDRTGWSRLHRWLGDVTGRGACHHPDGTARFVSTALSVFQEEVQMHRHGRCTHPRASFTVCDLPQTPSRTAVGQA